MPKRVILDVDTGVDDALAIAYALRSPGLQLEAITTTYGNIDIDSATRNTLQLLEILGAESIPVYPGAGRSLLHPYTRGGSVVHGPNGLGGVELSAPRRAPQELHAVDYLIQTARANPGEFTLIAVGPLTNLAMAVLQDPEAAKLFASVVIMGGAVTVPGNVTRVAEANIWSDPEAARIVFRSGANIVLVGLDVTMQTLLTPEDLDRINESAVPGSRVLAEATRFYMGGYQTFYPGIRGCAMHDPLAVAVAEMPDLVKTRLMAVDVECAGEITRGQTVGELRRVAVTDPNVNVCLKVDVDRFMNLLLQRLGA